MVQDMWNEGKLAEINDYCRCDVLDTYFVFLRSSVLLGRITLDREQNLIEDMKNWLVERADQVHAYQSYLEEWGDWRNPWNDSEENAETDDSESTTEQPT